jgi:VWA domain-containing protein
MPRLIRFVASLALMLGASFPAAPAQTGPAAAGGERRTVIVSVITEKGQLVNGLAPENFRAALGKQPVKIMSANYDSNPHHVVLLVDVSGSMDNKRRAESLMVENLLNWIGPENPIAVLAFSKVILARVPFSTDRAFLRAGLANLKNETDPAKPVPPRLTALYDAADKAVESLSPPQSGDTICLISDGANNSGKLREGSAKRIFGPSGVRIFSILIPEPMAVRGRTVEEAQGPDVLNDLSVLTGGAMVSIDKEEIDRAFGKWPASQLAEAERERRDSMAPVMSMAREMNAFYRLEIQLPAPFDKPQGLKVEVLDPATGKPDHKLILHYPSKLYPSAASEARGASSDQSQPK